MNVRIFCNACLTAALVTAGATLSLHETVAAQTDPVGVEDGVEVLTRGPVHEAFAETITFDPQPGIVVDKPAPEPIEELPPDQKPEGVNVDWIPGYWAWDDERNDFLWVSGIWRSLPPGRQWVPGYWAASGQGFQWTSGYWADAQASEIDYLPEPPETVEAGPNIDAPSPDDTWLPGCWIWQQNRYAWRPGFWATAHPNWIWTPAHYVWTPRGYVFVDGYYDYSVARRGVLFAPVYFNPGIYSRSGFSYSPVTVVNPAVFASHLFLRPNYGHYYFGDYYGTNYASLGFSPWFLFYSSRSGYDPLYAQQRWNHRSDAQWGRRVEADFAHRRDHEEARPPRTWTAQRELNARDATKADPSFAVATSLDEMAKRKEGPLRLQPVAKEVRQQIGQRGQEVNKVRRERQKLEAAAADSSAGGPVKPVKVKLAKTPIAAVSVERLGKEDAPPKAMQTPGPDPKIEPKARKARDKAASPPEPRATKRATPSARPPKVAPKEQPKRAPATVPKGRSVAPPKDRSVAPPKGGSKRVPQGGDKKKPRNE